MFCRKCGSEIKEGAKFCNKCGSEVRAVPNSGAVDGSFSHITQPDAVTELYMPDPNETQGGFEDVSSASGVYNRMYDGGNSNINSYEQQYDYAQADNSQAEIYSDNSMQYVNREAEKPSDSSKKLWPVLIPVIALIVAVAILVPTVIIPMLDKSSSKDADGAADENKVTQISELDDENVTSSSTASTTSTTAPTQPAGPARIKAETDDFQKLAQVLVDSRSVVFNSNTLTTAFIVDEILATPIAVSGYLSYFEDGTWKVPTAGDSAEDPLKKFSGGYIKLNAQNVKWICENIYSVQFDENYVSENSYCYGGDVYRKIAQGGEFSPVVKITTFTENKDLTYEVLYELSENNKLLGEYKAVVDLKLIDGVRHWTFYSVEAVS